MSDERKITPPQGGTGVTPRAGHITSVGGFTLAPPQRYRCRKGHVTIDSRYLTGHGAPFQVCPQCYAELIDRECGGVERLES